MQKRHLVITFIMDELPAREIWLTETCGLQNNESSKKEEILSHKQAWKKQNFRKVERKTLNDTNKKQHQVSSQKIKIQIEMSEKYYLASESWEPLKPYPQFKDEMTFTSDEHW